MTCHIDSTRVVGAYEYKDRTKYYGEWNKDGQRHGFGHLILPDSTRYDGSFFNGLFTGLGVLQFPDGARYEGEFIKGWFHGYGVFWRADSMKFEGEFRGGKICGYGLVTYKDGSHGFPRNEGVFMNCRMTSRKNCSDVIEKARWVSHYVRMQIKQNTRKLQWQRISNALFKRKVHGEFLNPVLSSRCHDWSNKHPSEIRN